MTANEYQEGRPFYFGDYDRSTRWKIRAARDVRSNSYFAALRIRFKLRLCIRDGVLSEFFRETKFFSDGTLERGLDLSRIQLRVHSESFQEVRSFPFELHNMAKSYQAPLEGSLYPVLRMPLKGA